MRDVQPFEARNLSALPEDPRRESLMRDLATAIAGTVHAGATLDAIVYAVRWLAAHPERLADIADPKPSDPSTKEL